MAACPVELEFIMTKKNQGPVSIPVPGRHQNAGQKDHKGAR